jgi:ParB/RepB/Spo0J family partition protein
MNETAHPRFDRAFESYRPESAALDPRKIIVTKGWNVRDMDSPETRDYIATLKASILARGVDKPITVRYDQTTGKVTLVDGQCRLTALCELWDEGHKIAVPAVRIKSADEAELTVASLVSNSGHPLTQWEIGVGCRRLQKYGMSPAQIAAQIVKPVRFVTEAIALADTPQEAKAMMAAGAVTPARVLQEVAEHGDEAVHVLSRAVEERHQNALVGSKGKSTKLKPLARRKEPNPTEKALVIADKMATITVDESQSWDRVIALAKQYMKVRKIA